MWRFYVSQLEKRPLFTKMWSTGIIASCGDLCTQVIESRMKDKELKFDLTRTARMCTFGTLLAGPMNHYWYIFVDKVVTTSGTTSVIKKIALDQTIFAPVILVTFFSALGTMEGQSTTAIKDNIATKIYPTLLMNYRVWPLAQAINFAFVPQQHRTGYVAIILLFWNSYLSYVNSN